QLSQTPKPTTVPNHLQNPVPLHNLQKKSRAATKPSIYREVLLHRSLIEALAGDAGAAKQRMAEAREIEEPDASILKITERLQKQIEALIAP
ncbi:hypothetical protein, partial [Haloferula sp. A504]|uniref:hypothetical protein n=1 Tax=Haloferula sp. A504 TaxID=3373601 RepID=UPI0031BDBEDD|nr:hypothetical protein [Verrucomicrobiaceae bacterium E54]